MTEINIYEAGKATMSTTVVNLPYNSSTLYFFYSKRQPTVNQHGINK